MKIKIFYDGYRNSLETAINDWLSFNKIRIEFICQSGGSDNMIISIFYIEEE